MAVLIDNVPIANMAFQTSSNVNITGGSITGITIAGSSVSNTSPNIISSNGITQNTATTTVALSFLQIVISANLTSNGVIVNNSTAYQKIINKSANTLLVYPFIGAQFDSYGFNNPVSLPTNNSIEITKFSASQLYIVG